MFWKLYAGKFFGNYVMGNSGGCRRLFDGVIMAQCYGITLQFKATAPGAELRHSGSTDLSRTMRSESFA